MATNSKGWTARLPVKVCCLIFIPVLAYTICFGALGILTAGYYDLNIVLADLSANDYFYDKFVPDAFSAAESAFLYQSEDNIRGMGCLEWREETWSEWDDAAMKVIEKKYYRLTDKYIFNKGMRGWFSTPNDLNDPEVQFEINRAINSQLNDFEQLIKILAETKGLYYQFSDGNRTLTNLTEERDADFFRSHPVYFIRSASSNIYSSRQNYDRTNPNMLYYQEYANLTGYIAFSSDAVYAQNAVWAAAQATLGVNLSLIIASALIILLLLLVLMAGAGRRYGSAEISFNLSDRVWLDIGLAALAAYLAAVCVGFFELAKVAWRYNNVMQINNLCAALSVLAALPAAAWLMSFAKRCKAGKWWRHTLIYFILHKICSGVSRFFKSLWAGFPLTLRVVLIGIAFFIWALICAAIDTPEIELLFSAMLIALSVFFMLRYARKLHMVEKGATAAATGGGSGRAQAAIAVKGGELGSIAESIGNISAGINAAVAERLKSDRLKTELITNISHDIRTPLTSIITYADLLKSEGADSPRAAEYLDVLIQKSARLKTLTDDLFEASKAASGNIDVSIENLDFADFVRQAVGELDARIQDSGLDFRLNLPEHAPVRADGKLLWRVIDNLLSNVFKYALAESRVYVDLTPDVTPDLTPDLTPEGGWYRLDIKNISEHPLNIDPSELTERFKRGDEARGGEGSGLGLSIAQSFAQAQGGRFALSIDGDLFKASVSLPRQDTEGPV